MHSSRMHTAHSLTMVCVCGEKKGKKCKEKLQKNAKKKLGGLHQAPPGADHSPPGADTPQGRHPPGADPPGAHIPPPEQTTPCEQDS